MNRAERRRMMRTIPGYRKIVKTAAKKAMNDFENTFKKKYWQNDDDEDLNDGEKGYSDDGEDEIYND